jgi:hypothetical protein
MSPLNIKDKIASNKGLIIFVFFLLILTLYFTVIKKQSIEIKLPKNENISITVPLVRKDVKFFQKANTLIPISLFIFTNNSKNYKTVLEFNDKGPQSLDYSKEFIVFNFFPDHMIFKDHSMEDNVKFSLPYPSASMFENTDSAWLACTDLFREGGIDSIFLSAIIKVDDYYVHGLLQASHKGYTDEDVKRLKLTLSDWVKNFKSVNNL